MKGIPEPWLCMDAALSEVVVVLAILVLVPGLWLALGGVMGVESEL